MSANERPRERLQRFGFGALTTTQLLSIVLRIGSAHEDVLTVAGRLLDTHNGLRDLVSAEFPPSPRFTVSTGQRPPLLLRSLSGHAGLLSKESYCDRRYTPRAPRDGLSQGWICCSKKKCGCRYWIPSTRFWSSRHFTEAQSTPRPPTPPKKRGRHRRRVIAGCECARLPRTQTWGIRVHEGTWNGIFGVNTTSRASLAPGLACYDRYWRGGRGARSACTGST